MEAIEGTTPRDRVASADGLRALAAFGVIVVHSSLINTRDLKSIPAHQLLAGSELAVDVFFVLSGFLLFLPRLIGREEPTRGYALKRVARIWPAYAVSVVFALVAWHWIQHISDIGFPLQSRMGLVAVLSHLTMTQWVAFAASPRWIGLGVSGIWWTLTVEVCFYVALPLVASSVARRPIRWLVGCFAFAVVWRLAMFHVADWGAGLPNGLRTVLFAYGEAFPGYAVEFAAGMVAAWAFVNRPDVLGARVRVAFFGAATACLALIWLDGDNLVRRGAFARVQSPSYALTRPLFSIAFALALFCIAQRPNRFDPVLGRGPLKWLGDRSYGIYLYHYAAILFLLAHTAVFADMSGWGVPFVVATVTAASVVAGTVSFQLVERPAMRWAHRRAQRMTPRAHGAAAAAASVYDQR